MTDRLIRTALGCCFHPVGLPRRPAQVCGAKPASWPALACPNAVQERLIQDLQVLYCFSERCSARNRLLERVSAGSSRPCKVGASAMRTQRHLGLSIRLMTRALPDHLSSGVQLHLLHTSVMLRCAAAAAAALTAATAVAPPFPCLPHRRCCCGAPLVAQELFGVPSSTTVATAAEAAAQLGAPPWRCSAPSRALCPRPRW